MIIYIVAWLAFSCPGGAFRGLIPKSMRQLVCEQTPATALYSSKPKALDKIRELGPPAKAEVCTNLEQMPRCTPLEIKWEPLIEEK